MKLFFTILALLVAQCADAAYTPVIKTGSYGSYLVDTSNSTVANVGGTPSGQWMAVDLGTTIIVSAILLYSGTSNTFPSSFDIQTTSSIVMTEADSNAAQWITIKSVTNLFPSASSPVMLGLDSPVTARSVRFIFNCIPASGTFFTFGNFAASSLTSDVNSNPTIDTYTKINMIYSDTQNLITGVSALTTAVNSGSGGGTGSPLDLPNTPAANNVPLDLREYVKPTDFAFASGVAGILAAFTIVLMWSRGL